MLLVAARVVGLGALLGSDVPDPVSIDASTRLSGELSLARPRQRFVLEASRSGEVTFETRSGLDLYLELDRVEGTAHTRVGEDDDSGEGVHARLTAAITPGHYELVVRPYSATTGPYVVEISVR
jgi:hypothetical protein